MRGPKLRREVLPPQKQSSGLGVMVVAAAAMFFAVASSAFVLRARMAQSHCDFARNAQPIVIKVDPQPPNEQLPSVTPPATTSDDCGTPVVTHTADGRDVYSYTRACDTPPVKGVLIRNIQLVRDTH